VIRQNNLSPAFGATRDKRRVGRGNGSGHGNYAGRGRNGQKARSGNNKMRPCFEGGQLPIIKRLPQKRGFTNHFRTVYSPVNLDRLNIFEPGTEVTAKMLLATGLVKIAGQPIKILGDGELKQALTVKADKFSASAKAKIEAAGGKAEEVGNAGKAD